LNKKYIIEQLIGKGIYKVGDKQLYELSPKQLKKLLENPPNSQMARKSKKYG